MRDASPGEFHDVPQWGVRARWDPAQTVALYTLLTGGTRLLVEAVLLENDVLAIWTAPQLWAVALVFLGPRGRRAGRRAAGGAGAAMTAHDVQER